MTVTARVSPTIPSRTLPLRMSERRTLLVAGDVVLLVVSMVVALWLWTVRGDLDFSVRFLVNQAHWFVILGGLWTLTAALFNFYRPEITSSFGATAISLLRITATMLVIYFLIYFVSPPNSVNRVIVIFFGALSLSLVGGWRAIYALLLHRSVFEQRALIVGAGHSGQVIARAITESLDRTYRIVGFVDDDASDDIGEVPILGKTTDLVRVARQHGATELVLALPDLTKGELFQALLDCQEQGIQITPMALLYESITGRVPVEHVGDQWYVVLPMHHSGNSAFYSAVKRSIDILVASVALLLYGLVLPWLALAIRLDTPGPIFYRQQRVGKGGRVFDMVKLRTMTDTAVSDTPGWASAHDLRVTRVGRFLRKTRLNELPQLFNILKGDMSLVGPRPELPELVADLERKIPFYRARHSVRPGAVGWALVHNGYARSVEETLVKLQYDLYYIKHQSFLLDLLIIIKSLGIMLTMRGA